MATFKEEHNTEGLPWFRQTIRTRIGATTFIEDGFEEVATGLDFELQYSLTNLKGLGIGMGLNSFTLPEIEGFNPFLNPFVGIHYGKYDKRIGFSIEPRMYVLTNPFYQLESTTEQITISSKIKTALMLGADLAFYFKLNRKTALHIYGNYKRGAIKLATSESINNEDFLNTTTNKLHIISTGIGLSFSL